MERLTGRRRENTDSPWKKQKHTASNRREENNVEKGI